MMVNTTKCLTVDDHPTVRQGLGLMFGDTPDLELVGHVQSGEEVVEAVRRLRPEVVIMDVRLPGIDGISAIKRIAEASPDVKTVMFSAYGDKRLLSDAIAAGARGYVMKGSPPEDLLRAIRTVTEGRAFVDPSLSPTLLMAQGAANFVAPFFGGIAVTGTIARTMTNVRSGARSPVAGIVHSVTLFLVILALAPLAGFIPLAALSAVLLWVAFNMVGWRELRELPRFSMFYRAILLSTLTLTVVFDLTVAVEVGLVMSSLFYIYRVSSLTRVDPIDLGERAALPGGRTRTRLVRT